MTWFTRQDLLTLAGPPTRTTSGDPAGEGHPADGRLRWGHGRCLRPRARAARRRLSAGTTRSRRAGTGPLPASHGRTRSSYASCSTRAKSTKLGTPPSMAGAATTCGSGSPSGAPRTTPPTRSAPTSVSSKAARLVEGLLERLALLEDENAALRSRPPTRWVPQV